MHRLLKLCFLLSLVLLPLSILAQTNIPNPRQIHRLIVRRDNNDSSNIRWIEIWESQDDRNDARQWVMIDAQSSSQGVDYHCHNALAIGDGTPIYMVDGERQPVTNAQTLFDDIQNNNLSEQSVVFVDRAECSLSGEAMINGIPSSQCLFQNVDMTGLYLIKGNATSAGELWRANDGGYMVTYDFKAQGTDVSVSHYYSLFPRDSDFTIQAPTDVSLQCFEDGFPLPANTEILTTNSVYATFSSEQSIPALESFYDNTLRSDWTIDSSLTDGHSYIKQIGDTGVCRLNLRLRPGTNNQSLIAAEVFPENIGEIQLPTDIASASVVQNAGTVSFKVEMPLQDIITDLVNDLTQSNWVVRDDLTDKRENSAFITLADGNFEKHIIAESKNDSTSVVIQDRSPICGPIFDHP